jgi:maltose phosphorylase
MDIEIDGDIEGQQGVRYSLFQLYQAYRGNDPRLNAPCKGLTAEVYYMFVFWDSETYCLPFYLFTDPKAARNLLEYRYMFLPQALDRAKELDCKGARYPFCTIDGTECDGTWQHVDLEIHVDVAVTYAIWLYDKITGDKEFLYEKGIEMLLQISRFLASRGEWSPLTGEFGFYGVMGPDEYHMMVNNNCYTNVMAKKTFEYTLKVIDEMKGESFQKHEAVRNKIGLQDGELADWKKMADKMRIPYDEKTGLYEQHDGFFDLPHIDVQNIPSSQIPIYSNWVYEKIFRYNMIKQPDFLLLPLFFGNDYSMESKRKNFEYYEAQCIHESSLSPCIHSILAAELGKHEMAYTFFQYMARLDLDNYNHNTNQGLHVTAMSGSWLSVVNGFAGMRMDGDVLSFKPSIPAPWNSYSFKLKYKDAVISIQINKKSILMKIIQGSDVDVCVYGDNYTINTIGTEIELKK